MKKKFTTTLEEILIDELKIEAIKLKKGANDIIEELLTAYFEAKK